MKIYYGTNLTDYTPIMCDRSDTTNAPQHRAIFGIPGSGRQFLMESEIAQIVKGTDDIVYVLDFQRGFINMTDLLGGCVVPITQNEAGCVNPVIIPDTSNFVVLDASEILYAKVCKENAIYMCLATLWEKIEAIGKAGSSNCRFWIFIDKVLPIIRSAYAEIFYTMIEKGRTHNCNITYSDVNFTDLCKNKYGKAALANTPILTLLNQSPEDRKCLSELYNLSSEELNFITEAPCYNGLFCANGNNIPFKYYRNIYEEKMFP